MLSVSEILKNSDFDEESKSEFILIAIVKSVVKVEGRAEAPPSRFRLIIP
jgi:hypothetical protein